jgi:hypothetical protein
MYGRISAGPQSGWQDAFALTVSLVPRCQERPRCKNVFD